MDAHPIGAAPGDEGPPEPAPSGSRRRLLLGMTSAVAGGLVTGSLVVPESVAAEGEGGDQAMRTVDASSTVGRRDAARTVEAGHATTAITITIPTDADVAFPLDSEICIRQTGSAPVTVVPAQGVTFRTTGGDATLACGGRWGEVIARKRGADDWVLSRRGVPGGSGAVRQAYDLVADFGADPTGERDSTAAVQAAVDAPRGGSAGASGVQIHVPPGCYRLTDTIEIDSWSGAFVGAGSGNDPTYEPGRGSASVFRWDGRAGIPMFRLYDCLAATFRQLRFQGSNANPPSAAIRTLGEGGSGTNSRMVVEDCTFGSYGWTAQGRNEGALQAGILFDDDDGEDKNNDEFRISRCQFTGNDSVPGAIGIDIPNSPQSVWGSVTDCLFVRLAVGVRTNSSVMLSNPQFSACARDLEVRTTATVHVTSWQSEGSGQLAKIGYSSKLLVQWGRLEVDRLAPTGGGIIDLVPSGANCVLDLQNVEFFGGFPKQDAAQPTIRFGPADTHDGVGFRVRIDNCLGIRPQHLELLPLTRNSRGLVEYSGVRGGPRVTAFRNVLSGSGRTSLDPSAYDLPEGAVSAGVLQVGTLRLANLFADPTGPHVAGELVVVGGVVKVCTASGTPGTWTTVGTQT